MIASCCSRSANAILFILRIAEIRGGGAASAQMNRDRRPSCFLSL
jgi:hypothetical protein